MSKGYGAVQRHVLARLAENDADPDADRKVPPYFQSWTPLNELHEGTPYQYESVRRALSKLVAAGVVEVRMLTPVRWYHTKDPDQPGARQRVRQRARRIRHGEYIDPPTTFTVWECPRRVYGRERIHARLLTGRPS